MPPLKLSWPVAQGQLHILVSESHMPVSETLRSIRNWYLKAAFAFKIVSTTIMTNIPYMRLCAALDLHFICINVLFVFFFQSVIGYKSNL
jgi:hypothetical protein